MLIQTPVNGELSLYFHLPFCKKKCHYCHFYVLPNKEIFKKQLLESMIKEISLKAPLLKNTSIISLYFGGGTPALVGPFFLEKIISTLNKYVSLAQTEITLEINPENNDLENLKSFRSLGINRLSMGVQTFDDSQLKRLNRSHNSEDTLTAAANASLSGFENLSIDLMYELPGQTLTMWKETLKQASQLPISHLSLYNLSIEPHTVFYKKREEIKSQMPPASTAIEMYTLALESLKHLNHYEISAFCKGDSYSKHNVGYWLQRPHLGFGPSAFSLYDSKRFQNIANIHRYSQQISLKKDFVSFEETLEKEPFLKESCALHLRLVEGFDPSVFQKRFGPFPLELIKTLYHLEKTGLLTQSPQVIKLTEKGLLFHDSIASEII